MLTSFWERGVKEGACLDPFECWVCRKTSGSTVYRWKAPERWLNDHIMMWPKSGMGLMGTVVITADGLQPLISAICPTCSLPIGLAPVALSSSNAFGGTYALLPCPWTCAAIWQSWPGGQSALEAHSGSTIWWDHPWQFLISESELRLGEVKVWCSEVFWTATLQLIRMKLPPAIPLSTDQILPSLPHLLGQRSAFLWIHPYYCVAVLNICLSFLSYFSN